MLKARFRQRIEAFLQQMWYPDSSIDQTPPSIGRSICITRVLLTPLAWLFSLIARQRLSKRRLYSSEDYDRVTQAVIAVIGNISVGGTGKTPVILTLTKLLIEQGYKVAVVSRGYGGTHSAARKAGARIVRLRDSAQLVGDEPALIVRRIARDFLGQQNEMAGQQQQLDERFMLAIAPNRLDAIKAVDQHLKPDIILSDDGLQHYAMPRDVEYLVIDGQRGFGNNQLLPIGPLRESISRLALCDYALIHGESDNNLQVILDQHKLANEQFFGSNIKATALNPAAIRLTRRLKALVQSASTESSAEGELTLDQLAHLQCVHLVAGLGNPERFFNAVKSQLFSINNTIVCATHAFADHHSFTYRDFYSIIGSSKADWDQLAVIVTEKDAVKLENMESTENIQSIPVAVFSIDYQVTLDNAALLPILDRLPNRPLQSDNPSASSGCTE